MVGHIGEKIRKRNRAVPVMLLVLVCLLPVMGNGVDSYFRDRTIQRDWGVHLLSTTVPGSLIITQQDEIFGLWYLKYGEAWAETVSLLHYESLHAPDNWFWNTVEEIKLRTCLNHMYALSDRIPTDNRILEYLYGTCGFEIYTTRQPGNMDGAISWVPTYLTWKFKPGDPGEKLRYKYTIFPVRSVMEERMNQVERYYMSAYVETYKILAQLEEENHNYDKALKLWGILYSLDSRNRRTAVRNINQLSSQ
jgi:hypothetical protein